VKKRVFVDANVLISGIFFKGNESKLLSALNVELITSDTVIKEIYDVARLKFKSLKISTQKIALQEIENALKDISEIIKKEKYISYLPEVEKLVKSEDDRSILAAVLFTKPDYFVTGDKHFYSEAVKKKVKIKKTKEVLKELKII
jgi:putative PIN family toxin of toxin-antitoxin system